MKRRVFLTTTGAIGVAGAASGATVVSSVFTSLSTNVSLQEFSASTKAILDNFIAELTLNSQEHGTDQKYIASLAMPVRIIKKNFKNKDHQIVYKNKAGDYINISLKNGVQRICITDTL